MDNKFHEIDDSLCRLTGLSEEMGHMVEISVIIISGLGRMRRLPRSVVASRPNVRRPWLYTLHTDCQKERDKVVTYYDTVSCRLQHEVKLSLYKDT
ncbi:hypothetical protein CHS0354_042438 [Potamilus streckersoni]|uniref:Uncharacterized protein n=1 Tax=Potamilus streckersoni TaxID=2493646 RepID=A0AAE0VSL9_9BIVA|nr:hypothetical protein CHS0354_042438 [Potamilus streckersoni]